MGAILGITLWALQTYLFFGLGQMYERRKWKKREIEFFACPHCSEPVRTGAAVCKSCHRKVVEATS